MIATSRSAEPQIMRFKDPFYNLNIYKQIWAIIA